MCQYALFYGAFWRGCAAVPLTGVGKSFLLPKENAHKPVFVTGFFVGEKIGFAITVREEL